MPSRREIERAVKRYQALMGFGREVSFTLYRYDHEKNPLPGRNNPYGGNDSQPQYRRCDLSFDFTAFELCARRCDKVTVDDKFR